MLNERYKMQQNRHNVKASLLLSKISSNAYNERTEIKFNVNNAIIIL